MSRILLVDDDADQLTVRRLVLEHAGHEVTTACDAAGARAACAAAPPAILVTDLRLGTGEDGLALVSELRALHPALRVIVVSGWTADLAGRVEAALVDAVVPKPARSQHLLATIARLAAMLFFLLPLDAATFPFTANTAGEAIADITLTASATPPPMADVSLDGRPPFQLLAFAGPESHTYTVFLGAVTPGPHQLSVSTSGIQIDKVTFSTVQDNVVLANAPVLYARRNTIGKFTDVPLLVYAQNLTEGSDPILMYTVIFSNEDGGTSTRALMARWGRTADIEYVYRLNLRTNRAIIQSRNHKDIEYVGPREGSHPVLMPITDNNMVGPVEGDPPPVRYQFAPVLVDLSHHSREHVMDERPWLYRIASEELEREGKLRPFGQLDGEKISDPRNYLYIETKVTNRNAGLSVNVRLKDDRVWRSGALGRADLAISRSEWVRTTVELPPGTQAAQVAEIGLECLVAPNQDRRFAQAGECTVEAITKVFLLTSDYVPGPNLWTLPTSTTIPTGQMMTFPLGK